MEHGSYLGNFIHLFVYFSGLNHEQENNGLLCHRAPFLPVWVSPRFQKPSLYNRKKGPFINVPFLCSFSYSFSFFGCDQGVEGRLGVYIAFNRTR